MSATSRCNPRIDHHRGHRQHRHRPTETALMRQGIDVKSHDTRLPGRLQASRACDRQRVVHRRPLGRGVGESTPVLGSRARVLDESCWGVPATLKRTPGQVDLFVGAFTKPASLQRPSGHPSKRQAPRRRPFDHNPRPLPVSYLAVAYQPWNSGWFRGLSFVCGSRPSRHSLFVRLTAHGRSLGRGSRECQTMTASPAEPAALLLLG